MFRCEPFSRNITNNKTTTDVTSNYLTFFSPKYILSIYYKALVRPTVEYASTVWDPHKKGDIHRLDMVQRRAARYVKNNYHNRSSVTDMLADLQWKLLQERRKEARLIMLYKVINNKIALDNPQLMRPKWTHFIKSVYLNLHVCILSYKIKYYMYLYKTCNWYSLRDVFLLVLAP